MKNKKSFGLGVFVCLLNKELSKILLVKRNKEKRKKWGADWGNIGGKIEIGETSISACLREAKEEAGLNLDANNVKLLYVKETPEFTPNIHALHFVYGCIIDEKTNICLNEESEKAEWFSLKKLPPRTLDSKEDLLKIACLMKEHN